MRYSLLLLCCLLFFVGGALSQQALVYMSPSGTTNTGCGALATPCLTLASAITSVTTGGTIQVQAGRYSNTGNLNIRQINKNVTIVGAGATSIFDMQVCTHSTSSYNTHLYSLTLCLRNSPSDPLHPL